MEKRRRPFIYEGVHKRGCASIPNNVLPDTIVDILIVWKGKLKTVQELFGLLKSAKI